MKSIIKTSVIAILSMIIFTAWIAGQSVFAQELKLAGSTTIQKRVLEPSAKAIEEATGIKITVRGINSGNGFKELVDGKIKASVSSSPLSLLLEKVGLPDDSTYQEHIIIEDIIVPIVHKSNPISELTWQQLSDIHTGKITNWKEVGGQDKKIVVITSQPTAATRTVFQKLVMNNAPYTKDVKAVVSTRLEVDKVAKYDKTIGAVSEGFLKLYPGKVKSIATEKISRPLSIITKGNPESDVQSVINFLKSPDAKKYFK